MACRIGPRVAIFPLWGGVHDARERTSAGVELVVQSRDMGVRTYCAGASSFIAKPVTHAGLVDVMRHLKDYWFDLVELPQ
jgi:hypothetical protein